jgi:hypothetical protein
LPLKQQNLDMSLKPLEALKMALLARFSNVLCSRDIRVFRRRLETTLYYQGRLLQLAAYLVSPKEKRAHRILRVKGCHTP